MISYSYYDQLSQNLRAPGQWAISSNRTVQRLLSQRKPPISPTQPAADKDAEGYINLTFGVDTNLSVAFNVSLNVTVGEVEPGSTGLVDDGTNGTLPFAMRETLWIVIPISVIYSTIFVIGVLGNVITCIVISRNRSMHTATNYYLFSLAISDLLLLITGVPQDIYSVWYRFPYPFGNTVCKMASFASESFANATVLTITAFTVERYVAICKPFLSHTMSKLSRAVRFVITIWLIAFGLAIPQALSMQIDTEFRTCTVRQEQTKHVFFISTVLVFVCPMSVITVLYILIWLQLRRSKFVRCGSIRSSSVRLKRSIIKRSSQRTVVTLQCDQNDSPLHHYSESVLSSSLQHPRLSETLPLPTSPFVHYAKSCPASPVRRHRRSDEMARESALSLVRPSQPLLHQHHRRMQSLVQSRYCATGGSSSVAALRSGSSTSSVAGGHPVLEQQLSGASEDGRINYSTRAQYNSTRHVVKMLVAVVIAFFLCWAPFHAQRLMAVYANDHNENANIRTAFEILTYVSGIFYYISTCINPVLYNIMSHKFREAFKECIKYM
ncbi:pyrokinin-1 receptor-like [Anopheles stephensi]|uniref:pyrokinin-1 receptor-like n=1 Tax=Anopheles stephensi TaxID=30069 RepID=UPI0016587D8F|nr:pyrokinin-1 receptor-like [Anopheles stephensi]